MLSRSHCMVDQNLLVQNFVHNSVNFDTSPTPLTEMPLQNMIEPPQYFTNGCRYSLL